MRTHRDRRVSRPVIVGAVVLTLLATAGCGDDNGAGAPTPPSPSTTVTTPSDIATTNVVPSDPSVPVYRPPYIDHVAWAQTEVGPSLQVYPTTSGRHTTDPAAMNVAWAEVVALDASAESPGMRAQFDCHWRFARIVDPEKASWNLEPERPVVDEQEMISARCNPGFAEEH
ncbi:DUF2599 domain-containing protein [Gordonia sp. ABSL1-1]|uniref:DUF2599 domain-containing protein n=1 Tax=Gordonia sp. ABSL1-1 TaxID=3053923 RepID=UPI002573B9EC|nr:DUF2599 domain-containing protein [Gordonia sp. ABSL1-1]MDL9936139.1 DUF2599 domain-containing protein [Gordonia sp. ABSL1-1]